MVPDAKASVVMSMIDVVELDAVLESMVLSQNVRGNKPHKLGLKHRQLPRHTRGEGEEKVPVRARQRYPKRRNPDKYQENVI